MFERIVFFDNRAVEATATKRPDGKYALTLKVHSAKLVAAGKGKESEEPMDEIVDIGVFSRPPGGKEPDEKVLYLEKHHITGKSGRAHDRTPVTNAPLGSRLLL